MIESKTMSTLHHHDSCRPNPLEIKQLAEFDASLGNDSEEEKRRKRIIYLRDAARQNQTALSVFKVFGFLFIPFALIPCFWPFLIVVWLLRKKSADLIGTHLATALEYWGIQQHEIL
jgi:hypothetical protein